MSECSSVDIRAPFAKKAKASMSEKSQHVRGNQGQHHSEHPVLIIILPAHGNLCAVKDGAWSFQQKSAFCHSMWWRGLWKVRRAHQPALITQGKPSR